MKPNNPVDHVVIVVKENHTFDNYFGTFPGANGDATLQRAADPPPSDPPHDHAAWLRRAQGAVRQQYHESDIPAYFAYARQFTLCDNYFTEVASQSEPNHLMLIAAASPIIDNSSAKRSSYQPQAPFDVPSLPASLERAGLTWRSFGDQHNYFNDIVALKGSPQIVRWTQFDADAAAGTLPNVSWLYAPGSPNELSEHPPYGKNAGQPTVRLGMQWTADRVKQIAQSRLWASTAIFITWDDWGGWYDHVEPRQKDVWKGGNPQTGLAYTNTQFSYGPRVGCLVLSPYAKKGIAKAFHSHASIVKFCEKTFGLQPLNARDAASDDMADCFDFQQAPLAPPVWSSGGVAPIPPRDPKPAGEGSKPGGRSAARRGTTRVRGSTKKKPTKGGKKGGKSGRVRKGTRGGSSARAARRSATSYPSSVRWKVAFSRAFRPSSPPPRELIDRHDRRRAPQRRLVGGFPFLDLLIGDSMQDGECHRCVRPPLQRFPSPGAKTAKRQVVGDG
jgi:phospholipase C